MSELEEQRKKVEELKKKILEQKKKEIGSNGGAALPAGKTVSTPQVSSTPTNPPHEGAPLVQKSTPVETSKSTPPKTSSPQQQPVAVTPLQAYTQALRQALSDGILSKDEEVLLATLRKTLNIREEDHAKIMRDIQIETYVRALMESWNDGAITADDMEKLEQLRERFKISAEEHLHLEKMVRQRLLKKS